MSVVQHGSRLWPVCGAFAAGLLAVALAGCTGSGATGSDSSASDGTANSTQNSPMATDTDTAATVTEEAPTETATMAPGATPAPTATTIQIGPLSSVLLFGTDKPIAPLAFVKFSATGNMALPRRNHTATLLKTGKVLIAGGTTYTTSGGVKEMATSSAELYDPATGAFTGTGSLGISRTSATATLLASGKVLVAGGYNTTGTAIATAELYDPATGHFTMTGSLHTGRGDHTATLLSNGKVVIAGGGTQGIFHASLSSVEVYDPSTGLFSAAGTLKTGRQRQSATLLASGKILIAGGWNAAGTAVSTTAEEYNPSSSSSAYVGGMTIARASQTATLLANGKVLLVGGARDANVGGSGIEELTNCDLYDPSAHSFTATGPLSQARAYHTATLLGDGRVLIIGGYDEAPYGPFDTRSYLASTETYDPASGSFATGVKMLTGRGSQTATLLPNGQVLVTGGDTYQTVSGSMGPLGLKSAELWG